MPGISRRSIVLGAGVCAAALGVAAGAVMPVRVRASSVPRGPELGAWAAGRFLGHWNCTQAVLEAFAQRYRVDVTMALKLATGFAGGMCQGALCGSFTGAYMVIGLAYGGEGAPGKDVAGRMTEFTSAMRGSFGALACSELLGEDMATAQGVQAAGERGLFKTFCPKLVEASVAKLQQIL